MNNKEAEQLIKNHSYRHTQSDGELRIISKKQIKSLAIDIVKNLAINDVVRPNLTDKHPIVCVYMLSKVIYQVTWQYCIQ